MFDFVLRRELLPRRRFGPAFVVAAFFYSGAAAFGAWAERYGRVVDRQDIVINFVAPARPRARPPPVLAGRPPVPRGPSLRAAASDKPRTVLAQAIIAPREIPQATPPEREPVVAAAAEGGEPADADWEAPAVPGGIVYPVVDASAAVVVTARPPEFDARMTHPEFISGPTPTYTEKALEREVEGMMEVRCVVTAEGRVRACRVLRSLPFMDRAVIDALEQRVYRPATFRGRPVEVYYRFRIPLRLKE